MKRRKIGAFGMYIKLYVGKKCHQVFFLLLKNAKVCGPSQKKLHGNTYEKRRRRRRRRGEDVSSINLVGPHRVSSPFSLIS